MNIVDTLTWVRGPHTLKTGVDFRRISPILNRSGSDFTNIGMGPPENTDKGIVQFVQMARGNGKEIIPIFDNFSAFAQDTWTVRPRLTLTYGLRWELNPAPGSANDTRPWVIEDIRAPVTRFAPKGETRLYETRYGNFAPRFGVAYQLSQATGYETVLRSGVCNFHDTGFGVASIAYDHIFPYFLSKVAPPGLNNTCIRYPVRQPAGDCHRQGRACRYPHSISQHPVPLRAPRPNRLSHVSRASRRVSRSVYLIQFDPPP